MADPSPAVQLTSSTPAALQRIATAPATSEQGLSGAAQAVFWEFNRAASGKPYDWHYLPAIAAAIRTAAIRTASEQCIAIPGHNPSTEWLAGFQAARHETHQQLHKLSDQLEDHGQG